MIRNSDSLSLVLGNKHYTFSGDRVNGIFEKAMIYHKSPTFENHELLIAEISPIFRQKYAEHFTFDGTNYYLGQTSTPIPQKLAETIVDFVEKDYPLDSFTNFWKLCMANPNKEARDKFFDYCQKYGIAITSKGYAILYKAVNKRENGSRTGKIVTNQNLAHFVSASLLKVKGMKKGAHRFSVYKTIDGYVLHETYRSDYHGTGTFEGNLHDLSANINTFPQESGLVFTPGHHGSHGMEIVLGEPVTMPREKCDPNINNECSYGLHIGSYQYVRSFGEGMDTILACLVNPADIVAIPQHDTSKIRCCRYYPYAVIERDRQGNWDELESRFFEEDYEGLETEEMHQLIESAPASLTDVFVNRAVQL